MEGCDALSIGQAPVHRWQRESCNEHPIDPQSFFITSWGVLMAGVYIRG